MEKLLSNDVLMFFHEHKFSDLLAILWKTNIRCALWKLLIFESSESKSLFWKEEVMLVFWMFFLSFLRIIFVYYYILDIFQFVNWRDRAQIIA